MQFEAKTVRNTINKAFLKEPVDRGAFDQFKEALGKLLNGIEQANEAGEREEHFKNLLPPFFKAVGFEDYKINTSSNVDLAIYTGGKTKDPLGVMMEIKRPFNKSEMISGDRLNRKAMHEAVLYYLEQRIEEENSDLKHVIITDMTHWYIFDAQEFERCFYRQSTLRKAYKEWKDNRKVSSNTDFMYNEIASFISNSDASISGISLPLEPVRKLLKGDKGSEYEKRLIALYKFFSPIHLLKEPFANDSNSLNKEFYRELLYILGLEETKEGSTRYIRRTEEKNRQSGSMIENTIRILDAEDHLSTLKQARSNYGSDREEQLFSVAMELGITWMNRILFLKLLEAQLYRYHRKDNHFKFLNFDTIDSLDELNKLFFQVLARKKKDHSDDVNEKFGHIPYLNSSLFDVSDLEHQTTRISGLDDHAEMPVYSKSVLSNERENTLNTLDYLFRFLEAYDFSAEGSEEIRDESKSLINASVLGLIFEKINGYKDGSFYTPGFITEYMARETLQKAVVDAFNQKYEWTVDQLDELYNQIHRKELPLEQANSVINNLKICDPAVGSGHFLVSCLNELIAMKSELGILCDSDGKILRSLNVTTENDELILSWEDEKLFEYDVSHTWTGNRLTKRSVTSENQRIQKALFHEKRHIIENCLFGVDINPNSVKICRLRLWIELLKRAYYTERSDHLELEVLPNIDINIKQGNSLVSRFGLDSDLSSVFKNSEHSLDDYKEAVRNYKHTGDRTEKARLQTLIDDIKSEYKTTLTNIRPINKKISKARGRLEIMQSDDLFGEVKFTKKQITEQEKKLKKLEEQKAEEESGTFYNQAFEWRFEFPEVLDGEGRFTGFDVVIGNPPYGIRFSKDLNDYLKTKFETNTWRGESYLAFVELAQMLLKSEGIQSFIIPDTLLNLGFTNDLRNYLLENSLLLELVLLPTHVFENATVDTILLFTKKRKSELLNEKVRVKFFSKDSTIKGVTKAEKEFYVQLNYWKELQSFNLYSDEEEIKIILKLDQFQSLEEIGSVYSGIKTYEVGKGTPPQTKEIRKNKPFTSVEKKSEEWSPFYDGKHIGRFVNYWNKDNWIKYGEWLAAPRDSTIFEGEKILARKIVSDRLIATYIPEKSYCNTLLFIIKLQDESYTYKGMLAILNSKLIGWYYRKKFQINPEDTFPQILIRDINQFPIPKLTSNFEKESNSCINKILNAKKQNPEADTTELESEIDRLVYELYGLSEEEIGIVEGRIN